MNISNKRILNVHENNLQQRLNTAGGGRKEQKFWKEGGDPIIRYNHYNFSEANAPVRV
jgi:hypothetical protein